MKKITTADSHRKALLLIGAQHPAWSADADDKLVRIFNQLTAQAREAVGAVGANEDKKADWCSREAEKPTKTKAEIDRELAIIELAREEHGRDGECEIDDGATLSEGDDNGTYVQAWVWVSFEGTPFDKESMRLTCPHCGGVDSLPKDQFPQGEGMLALPLHLTALREGDEIVSCETLAQACPGSEQLGKLRAGQ